MRHTEPEPIHGKSHFGRYSNLALVSSISQYYMRVGKKRNMWIIYIIYEVMNLVMVLYKVDYYR